MKRRLAGVVLALCLWPCAAGARTVCIQHDSNGDVLVLKGFGRGAKGLSGSYMAHFSGGSSYTFRPLSGSSIGSSDDELVAGLTEYDVTFGSFQETTVLHRVRCNPGSDGRLAVGDTCSDVILTIDTSGAVQGLRPGHIIPCLSQLSIH